MNNISLHPHLDVNLALNKPTDQSSVYQPEVYGYDPHGACISKPNGYLNMIDLIEGVFPLPLQQLQKI